MFKRYWIPGQWFCSVWPKEYFKPLLSYGKTPPYDSVPRLEYHLDLYSTRPILLLLSAVEALLFLQHHTGKKQRWHELLHELFCTNKATAPSVLLHSLCWKSPALLQLRHLCWNLDNDRSVTEKCQLRALDYADSSVTIVQFYGTAVWMSAVPHTTKSHCGQGDNPGYSPALQANTGEPRSHQGDILTDNLVSNNSFLLFLASSEQQLQWLHYIGIAQFKMLNIISLILKQCPHCEPAALQSYSSALNSKVLLDPQRHCNLTAAWPYSPAWGWSREATHWQVTSQTI